MIADLPMYDHPMLHAAHDALWHHIRSELEAQGVMNAPEKLLRSSNLWKTWQSKQLLLGQVCAMPFRQVLYNKVNYVGTFDYGLEELPAGYFASWVVVHKDDPRSEPAEFNRANLIFNSNDSHSGWYAARRWADQNGIVLTYGRASGSHVASARAIANKEAEIATIDCVSWRAIEKFESSARQLKRVDRTSPCPGQALITSLKNDPDLIRAAIEAAIETVDPDVLTELGIRGFHRIPPESYLQE